MIKPKLPDTDETSYLKLPVKVPEEKEKCWQQEHPEEELLNTNVAAGEHHGVVSSAEYEILNDDAEEEGQVKKAVLFPWFIISLPGHTIQPDPLRNRPIKAH